MGLRIRQNQRACRLLCSSHACTSYVQVATAATCTLTLNLTAAVSANAHLARRLLRLRWLLLCQAC